MDKRTLVPLVLLAIIVAAIGFRWGTVPSAPGWTLDRWTGKTWFGDKATWISAPTPSANSLFSRLSAPASAAVYDNQVAEARGMRDGLTIGSCLLVVAVAGWLVFELFGRREQKAG